MARSGTFLQSGLRLIRKAEYRAETFTASHTMSRSPADILRVTHMLGMNTYLGT